MRGSGGLWCVLAGVMLVALSPRPARGLDPGRALTQYLHDRWTVDDGLPSNTVIGLLADRDGQLWIGTDEGMARFDGAEFEVFDRRRFPSMDVTVRALAQSADGDIWVGSDNGGGVWRWRDGQPSRPDGFQVIERKPARGFVRSILPVADDAIWVATSRGLQLYRSRSLRLIDDPLPSRNVRALVRDTVGRVWIGTQGGLARWEGKRLVADAPVPEIRSLAATRDGRIWMGTMTDLHVRHPDGRVEQVASPGYVFALLEDRDSNLWIGTSRGLVRRTSNGAMTTMTSEQGLASDDVRSLCEDGEGSLWVGTRAGLERLRSSPFTTLSRREGLPHDHVTGVHEDRDGGVWLSTRRGLARVTSAGVQVFDQRHGLPDAALESVLVDVQGQVWTRSRTELYRRTGAAFVRVPVPSAERVFFDRAGRQVWIQHGDRFESAGGASPVILSDPALLKGVVGAAHRGRAGAAWFGTAVSVYRFAEGRWSRWAFEGTQPPGPTTALHEDDRGFLWVGSEGGGLRRLGDKGFFTITTRHGLIGDYVLDVLEDERQRFWISTTRGLGWVRRDQLDELATGRRTSVTMAAYGEAAGVSMQGLAPSQSSAWRTRSGHLWFATARGAVTLHPDKLGFQGAPSSVLQRVTVDGELVRAGATTVRKPRARLEFTFRPRTLIDTHRVRMRYRLQGVDEGWVEAGTRRSAQYANVPPGRYAFYVAASSAEGRWDTAGVSFALSIPAPFHRTPAFGVAIALIAAAMAWIYHRLRLRRAADRYRVVMGERTRIAREIHDNLAQGLGAGFALLQGARRALPAKPDQAAEHIEVAMDALRGSLAETRRSMWMLRLPGAPDADLAAAVRDLARVFSRGRELSIQVEGSLPRLTEEAENEILRVVQEAMGNAIRHAGASRVMVSFRSTETSHVVTVEDDGCGFDVGAMSRQTTGCGLTGMNERAAHVGARLDLQSTVGRGTRVQLTLDRRIR